MMKLSGCLKQPTNNHSHYSVNSYAEESSQRRWKNVKITIVVGKDAAHTPSRLSVRSSTPDATTCEKNKIHVYISHS